MALFSYLDALLFGYRLLAGDGEPAPAPQRVKVKFVGATVEDDVANEQTVVTITGDGAAPAARTITAGAGLQGGGDLSANRSFALKLRGSGSGLALYGDGLGVLASTNNGTLTNINGVGVKCSSNGGLLVGTFGADAPADAGVGIVFGLAAGLKCDAASGLSVKLTAANPCLVLANAGLDVKLGTSTAGLVATPTGLDVNTAKVPLLVGGTITAAQSRGQTLLPLVRDTSDSTIAITGVLNASGPTFNGTARDTAGTRVLTGSIVVAAGDTVDFQAFINAASAASNFDVYIRLSSGSTMASPGTIYAEQHVSGTTAGGGVALFESWTATVSATLYWSVVVAKYSAIANFNVAQRNAVLKTFRT